MFGCASIPLPVQSLVWHEWKGLTCFQLTKKKEEKNNNPAATPNSII